MLINKRYLKFLIKRLYVYLFLKSYKMMGTKIGIYHWRKLLELSSWSFSEIPDKIFIYLFIYLFLYKIEFLFYHNISVYVCETLSWKLEPWPLFSTPHTPHSTNTYTCEVTNALRMYSGLTSFEIWIVLLIFKYLRNWQNFP